MRNLRSHLILSQKIIVATGILENIAHEWGEELPDGEEQSDDDGDEDDGDKDADIRVVYADGDAGARARGQVERDHLLERMPN